MTGLIDDINHDVTRGQHVLNLAGRDNAGPLVDCSAPVFTAENMTPDEVINKIVKPFGITKIAIRVDKSTAPKKFSIEPGQTAWSALIKVAEVNGLWPWIAPDGTLIIGGPDYSAAPVDSLVMNADGTGNLLRLGVLTSIAGRYSQVTVLSQSHGTASHNGAHNRHGTATDAGMTLYRPFIEVMGDTDTDDMATARARKILSDSRLKGLTLTATVRGVRTASGTAWQPGQRVAVKSDIHGIDAIYFIMARTIECGRGRELASIRRPFRAALSRITTEGGVMTAQLDGLQGETLQALEVFQHFGITSVPPEGAMAIILPVGGNTSHGVVVATEHSEYRIQSLKPGEVAIYNSDGASITLKNGKAIHMECDAFTAVCKTWQVTASESAGYDTPDFATSQNATVKGLFTGSGGMSISGDNGSGAAASFAGSINHTSGSISSVSVRINGVEVDKHIHTTPDGNSGPMQAG